MEAYGKVPKIYCELAKEQYYRERLALEKSSEVEARALRAAEDRQNEPENLPEFSAPVVRLKNKRKFEMNICVSATPDVSFPTGEYVAHRRSGRRSGERSRRCF
jgi:hypothetical protein